MRDYVYKPETPEGNLISNEVYVLRPGPVLDALDGIRPGTTEWPDPSVRRSFQTLVDVGYP